MGRVGTASSRRHLTRDRGRVERADLRRLLDSAARARLSGEELGRCGRCGTPWFLRTRGCPACSDRHWFRSHQSVNGHRGIAGASHGPAPSLGAPRRASLVAIPDVFRSFSGSLRRRRPARGDWTPALRPAVRGSSARPSRRRRSSTPRPPRRRSSARRSSLVRRTDLRGVLEHRAIAARIQSNRSGRLPWTSRRQNNAPLRKTPAARLKAALADHRLRPPQRRARPTLVRRT